MATQNLTRRSELETFASFLNPIQKEIPKTRFIQMPKIKRMQRDMFHEYEGFQIGETLYCVLFSVEKISDNDFDVQLKEVASCHLLHGDEYKVMSQVPHDLYIRIENICYDYFDRTMPEDFLPITETETWEQKGIYGNY